MARTTCWTLLLLSIASNVNAATLTEFRLNLDTGPGASSVIGQGFDAQITLSGDSARPTGIVLIDDGQTQCEITLPAKSCVLIPRNTGRSSFTAFYMGDSTYGAATSAPVAHKTTAVSFPQLLSIGSRQRPSSQVLRPDGEFAEKLHLGGLSDNGRFLMLSNGYDGFDNVEELFLLDIADPRHTKQHKIGLSPSIRAMGRFDHGDVSNDGRHIVFTAHNENGMALYHFDRHLQAPTALIQLQRPRHHLVDAQITPDGRFVAFKTNASLAARDLNTKTDVYLYDRDTASLHLASQWRSGQAAGVHNYQLLSDGNVAFAHGKRIASYDWRLRKRRPMIAVEDDLLFQPFATSKNRRFVAYPSAIDTVTLVNTHTGQRRSWRKTLDNKTCRVHDIRMARNASTLAAAFSCNASDGYWGRVHIHVFQTNQANLGPRLNDGATIATKSNLRLSANGRQTVFTNRRSVRSVDLAGATDIALQLRPIGSQGNGKSQLVDLSGSGRYALFSSTSSNLVDETDQAAVYIRDRQRHVTHYVGDQGETGINTTGALDYSVSNSGLVAYSIEAGNSACQAADEHLRVIQVIDTVSGEASCVSTALSGQLDGHSFAPKISADGQWVAFYSEASTLISDDSNAGCDAFLAHLSSGVIERISTNARGQQGVQIGTSSCGRSIGLSSDGQFVIFSSNLSGLTTVDTNSTIVHDTFVKDRHDGKVSWLRASAQSLSISDSGRRALVGTQLWRVNQGSVIPLTRPGFISTPRLSGPHSEISADGRFATAQWSVVYAIFPGPPNAYLYDLRPGHSDVRIDLVAAKAHLTANGSGVAMGNRYSGPGDNNQGTDVFYGFNPLLAPSATDDTFQSTPGMTLTVAAASGLLANDAHPRELPLEVYGNPVLVHGNKGRMIVANDGGFTYVPLTNNSGSSIFRYQVTDGRHRSSAYVTIGVPEDT